MRRNTIILLVIVLIVLIVVGLFITDPDAAQQVLVDLELAEPVEEGYTSSGLLEAHTALLSNETGGRVDEVLIFEGQRVQSGDALIILDPTFIEPELDAALAQLDAASAQLEMLEADPRPVDIAVAQAAIEYAHKIWEAAELALEGVREGEGTIAQEEQMEIARATVQEARASLILAGNQMDALFGGATEAELEMAMAAVTAAEAQVASVEAKLERQKIKAPFDGVIMESFVLPSENVLPGQPIMALADLNELELVVYFPESDLGWARVGDEVVLRVDGYPDETFQGFVKQIADLAEYTPRNVQTPEERVILVYAVRIRVPNQEGMLKPGLPAEATFGGEL
ncbi:MAG: HlyD family efflux transporter periplasmic adaptor subunit [Anaerolineales bacterium]|nr:HlyD family efflux transporter periplasmic adaptor subunit [Anaerolineales bacterium]